MQGLQICSVTSFRVRFSVSIGEHELAGSNPAMHMEPTALPFAPVMIRFAADLQIDYHERIEASPRRRSDRASARYD